MKKMAEQPKDLRPREKLQRRGAASLTDYELIMAIIGSGSPAAGVTEIARDIVALLKRSDNQLIFGDLLQVTGLGTAKATQLMASYELWRRRFQKTPQPIIAKLRDVLPLLQDIRTKRQEYFVCLSLDGANRLINKRIVSIGILNASLVHPREVFADVITDRAAAIIVAHNHPGGTLEPSDEDIATTKRLKSAAELLGIAFIDHIIVTSDDYLSIMSSNKWLMS